MKCDFILTPEQRTLVEENLTIIDKAINLFTGRTGPTNRRPG